jgi:F-type H+-transporting ATPase subunit b
MTPDEMNAAPAVHAETQAAPAHEASNPLLRIDPGMILWTWIVFFTLLILLAKFAWKPILKVLDEREQKIRKALDDADAAKKALEDAIHQQNQIIGKAQEEAVTLMQRARESAQTYEMELQNKAMKDAEHQIENARRVIDSEKQKAVAELRKEAADIAILAATKLVGANLDDAKNRNLVDKYIHEVTR